MDMENIMENAINSIKGKSDVIIETLKTGRMQEGKAVFRLAGKGVQPGCPSCTFGTLKNLLKFVQYAKHVFDTEICVELEQGEEFYAQRGTQVVEMDEEFCQLADGWNIMAELFGEKDSCRLIPTFKGVGPTWLAKGKVLEPINKVNNQKGEVK